MNNPFEGIVAPSTDLRRGNNPKIEIIVGLSLAHGTLPKSWGSGSG